jgi:arginine decarboxylase
MRASRLTSGWKSAASRSLFAGLALQNQMGSLIICNGYKDADFIKMALLGTSSARKSSWWWRSWKNCARSSRSRNRSASNRCRHRARLLSKGAGKWAESGGENAKFGLSTAEILADGNVEGGESGHCLKLVHFHIGSQVPDILTVKKAVQEAGALYAKLRKMGFEIEYLDVGGGLGVDYDGSRSAFDSSTNYSLQEYTNDIVYYVADVCNAEKVPHPDIISESGRAIVAHHSVLVVEVFGSIDKTHPDINFTYGDNEHPSCANCSTSRRTSPS